MESNAVEKSPWRLIFRAFPEAIARWVWIADLLALVAIVIGALSQIFPLWPVVAIAGFVWASFTIIAFLISINIVFAQLGDERKNLIRVCSELQNANEHLRNELHIRPDLKELRDAKFRNKLVDVSYKNEIKNFEDYFAILFLSVIPYLASELGIHRIALFEVALLSTLEAKTLYYFPMESDPEIDRLNDLECGIAKHIEKAGVSASFSNFRLDNHEAFLAKMPIKGLINKWYVFSFCLISTNQNITDELKELCRDIERVLNHVYERLESRKEIIRLTEFAKEVEFGHASAIIFLDAENIPRVENKSDYSKEEIRHLENIIYDPQNTSLLVKAFEPPDSGISEQLVISRSTYLLYIIPLQLASRIWRAALVIVEAPGRQLSSNTLYGEQLGKTFSYLHRRGVKDELTDLSNKWFFLEFTKRAITSSGDISLALYVIKPRRVSRDITREENQLFIRQISRTLNSWCMKTPLSTIASRFEGDFFLLLDKVIDNNLIEAEAIALQHAVKESSGQSIQIGVVVFPCRLKKTSEDIEKDVLGMIAEGIELCNKSRNQPNIVNINSAHQPDPHLPVLVEEQGGKDSAICVYCSVSIEIGESVCVCKRCGTLHHKVCWNENDNHCAVLNCGSTDSYIFKYSIDQGV